MGEIDNCSGEGITCEWLARERNRLGIAGKGEVWARCGPNIDWSLGRDGPWKGYPEDKEK